MAEGLKDEQWRNILELAEAAVKFPKHERLAFLEAAGSSSDVIRQVLILTEAFEQPAQSSDRVGANFGHFLVTEHLGRGGMGEVYSARDVELERTVALKFLTPDSIGVEGAGERFIREARTASSLNHPNIVTIHEVIRQESTVAIVMELIEGKPLRQLCSTPLAIQELVHIGRQIADALAAAHAAGVVHRDLKPENVMLRSDGRVKVLDFGLARRFATPEGNPSGTSVSDVFAGTWRYMSPEQVKGEPLTGASDVFSFGLVLYELATGRHPFSAASAFETLQAIAGDEAVPPLKANSGALPEQLNSLILAMLAKDPAKRPSAASIAQVLAPYDSASDPASLSGVSLHSQGPEWLPGGRYRVASAVIGVAVVVAAIWFGVHLRKDAPMVAPTFLVSPLTSSNAANIDPAISPDGARAAFTSNSDQANFAVYVTDLSGGQPVRLTHDSVNNLRPAWSRDGRWLAFLRVSPRGVEVMVLPAEGGTERKVAQIELREWFNWKSDPLFTAGHPGPVWAADDESLFVTDSQGAPSGAPLWQVSLNTGRRKQLTHPPNIAHDFYPSISHDGSKIAFVRQSSAGVSDVFVLDLKRETETRMTNDGLDFRGITWGANDKSLLFASNRAGGYQIWVEPLDTKILEPLAIAGNIVSNPSLSADGKVLLYRNSTFNVNIWSALAADSRAEPAQLAASTGINSNPAFSPDGQSVAWTSNRSGSWEIWIANADGSAPTQRTHLGRHVGGRMVGPPAGSPQWSPDGRRIAFDARPNGRSAIMIMDVVGGEPRPLDLNSNEERTPTWSADGRYVYFNSNQGGDVRIWKRPAQGGQAIPVTARREFQAFESPDGKTLYLMPAVSEPGIYRMPANGGPEEMLPGTSAYYIRRHWAVSRDGIYFAGHDSAPLSILFYRFASGQIEPVRQLQKPLFVDTLSLAFNQLTGRLAFAEQDEESSNIMVARTVTR
jgi:eukaryotic-like serine/threonine-protein kinase